MEKILQWCIVLLVIWGIPRMCGVRTSLSISRLFLKGEQILYYKRFVWLGSAKSLPSYRWWFSLPPLIQHRFYVTDKRILHIFSYFWLFSQEFNQWFLEEDCRKKEDVLQDVGVGRSSLFGSYLWIVSKISVKRWLRSPEVQFRLFIKDPLTISEITKVAMTKNLQQ